MIIFSFDYTNRYTDEVTKNGAEGGVEPLLEECKVVGIPEAPRRMIVEGPS